jgi:transglutaminase-like putative cysteine protease
MRYILYFFFFALIGSLSATENPDYSVANISEDLLVDANSVVRVENHELKLEALNKYTEEVLKVVTILNEKSRDDYLNLFYSNTIKIEKIEARLFDKEGKEIRRIKKSDIMDYSAYSGSTEFSDSRRKYISFTNRSYPYTIEIKYKTVTKTLHWPFEMVVSNEKRSYEKKAFTVKAKSGIDVVYKSVNTDMEPTISEENGYKIYKWKKENVPALKGEQFAPSAYEIFEKVVIKAQKFKFDKYSGSLSSWEEYGAFLYEINKDRHEVSDELKAQIQKLTAGAQTNKERIEILYRYLQGNTRYVSIQLGIGGYQTYDAGYVEKNKFGDCKALSNFMGSLLKVAGIESYSACIFNGRNKPQYWDDFAMPSFNHVVQYVPSEDLWIECTSNNYPLGYLGSGNEGKNVLIFSEKGGEFTKAPQFPKDLNFSRSEYLIEILPSGAAIIEGKRKFSGVAHEYYRYASFEKSQTDFEKEFVEDYPVTVLKLNELELNASMKEPTAELNYKLEIARYGSKAGKRLFVPMNPFHLSFGRLPNYEERKFDVVNNYSGKFTEHITLKLPEGFEIESLPEDGKTIDSDFGMYSIELTKKEGEIKLTRTFVSKIFRQPPERYEDLKEFYKQVDTCDNAKLVLVKKKT